MGIPVLYPHFAHPALEEAYASQQTLDRLCEAEGATEVRRYSPTSSISEAMKGLTSETVILVTSPLVVTAPGLTARLHEAMTAERVDAAVPVANDSEEPRQIASRYTPYLTLREFEEYASGLPNTTTQVEWGVADPGVALVDAGLLRECHKMASKALTGRRVALAGGAAIHRWVQLRAQDRSDILARIDPGARSILDLGCAEGVLGAAVKARQPCRVVGVELDAISAAVAARRLDRVVVGDVESLLPDLDETFDCITAGDVLEHVADPWRLIDGLRRVAKPGCRLIASMPNAGHGSIISDLLAGRFDYLYIGITCVGHLRFYTRRSIHTTFRMAGWNIESFTPTQEFRTAASERLAAALRSAGVEPDADFFNTGFYIVATPSTLPGRNF